MAFIQAARQALEGLVRSIAKELRNGGTANLLFVPAGADAAVPGPVRFFLSGRSAYVDGQVVTVSEASLPGDEDHDRPLAGKGSDPSAGRRALTPESACAVARR